MSRAATAGRIREKWLSPRAAIQSWHAPIVAYAGIPYPPVSFSFRHCAFRMRVCSPSVYWNILLSAWHRILLWHSAFPLSAVFARQARPVQRITIAIRGSEWIGRSPLFVPAPPTAYLIGKLKPPPFPASCQGRFPKGSRWLSLARAATPRHSAALCAVPSGRDGRGRKHKEGDQPCLTPNQAKAPPRNPQPTSPTRYATAKAAKASGPASGSPGHTPTAKRLQHPARSSATGRPHQPPHRH